MRPTFTNTLKSRNVLIFLILAACLVAPALAGTKYFNGNPNLTAYIAGTDQYTDWQ